MADPEQEGKWYMVGASWSVALVVNGTRNDALHAAKEYGRLNQFPNEKPPIIELDLKKPAVTELMERHPLFLKSNPLEFLLEGDGSNIGDLVPIVPESKLKFLSQSSTPEV